MNSSLKEDCEIIKAFNNNIVLVQSEGKEKMLFQKGIGFSKRPGDKVLKGTEIEKIFIIEDCTCQVKNVEKFQHENA